jgi:hypothetical protein
MKRFSRLCKSALALLIALFLGGSLKPIADAELGDVLHGDLHPALGTLKGAAAWLFTSLNSFWGGALLIMILFCLSDLLLSLLIQRLSSRSDC